MTQVKSVRGYRANFERAVLGTTEHPRHHFSRYRELTSEELGLARRMARDVNCSYDAIAKAIGWTTSIPPLIKRLNAVNIRAVGGDGRMFLHLMHYEARR